LAIAGTDVRYRGTVAKKTARRGATTSADTSAADGINPRQPCPCGSGRRYKACHGAADAADMIVARPFAGLASETELIALREFVPSATAVLHLRDAAKHSPSITLGSVLPGAAAALTRADGSILVGTQVQTHSGDLSRDIASAIEWALAAEPSSVLSAYPRASVGARLQDLLVDEPFDVTVHDDFAWWLEDEPEPGSQLAATLDLGEGTRYVGSFRAHGCVVPVWDLDREAHSSEWVGPVGEFAARLDAALAVSEPLSSAERRARDGILGRQFTLR
jgi:hypothetical protein